MGTWSHRSGLSSYSINIINLKPRYSCHHRFTSLVQAFPEGPVCFLSSLVYLTGTGVPWRPGVFPVITGLPHWYRRSLKARCVSCHHWFTSLVQAFPEGPVCFLSSLVYLTGAGVPWRPGVFPVITGLPHWCRRSLKAGVFPVITGLPHWYRRSLKARCVSCHHRFTSLVQAFPEGPVCFLSSPVYLTGTGVPWRPGVFPVITGLPHWYRRSPKARCVSCHHRFTSLVQAFPEGRCVSCHHRFTSLVQAFPEGPVCFLSSPVYLTGTGVPWRPGVFPVITGSPHWYRRSLKARCVSCHHRFTSLVQAFPEGRCVSCHHRFTSLVQAFPEGPVCFLSSPVYLTGTGVPWRPGVFPVITGLPHWYRRSLKARCVSCHHRFTSLVQAFPEGPVCFLSSPVYLTGTGVPWRPVCFLSSPVHLTGTGVPWRPGVFPVITGLPHWYRRSLKARCVSCHHRFTSLVQAFPEGPVCFLSSPVYLTGTGVPWRPGVFPVITGLPHWYRRSLKARCVSCHHWFTSLVQAFPEGPVCFLSSPVYLTGTGVPWRPGVFPVITGLPHWYRRSLKARCVSCHHWFTSLVQAFPEGPVCFLSSPVYLTDTGVPRRPGVFPVITGLPHWYRRSLKARYISCSGPHLCSCNKTHA